MSTITEIEQQLLQEALANLGLKAPKEKEETEEKVFVTSESRTIRGVITCALCKTTTVQYIRFERWSDGSWRMGRDYTEEECKGFDCNQRIQLQKAVVKSCWACESVLLSKDKAELVKMIIQLYAPIPSKREIWKYINELRSISFKENKQKKQREERFEEEV